MQAIQQRRPLRRREASRSGRLTAARPDDPWNATATHRAKPRGGMMHAGDPTAPAAAAQCHGNPPWMPAALDTGSQMNGSRRAHAQ
jgi:hypothetical protein